MSQDHSISQWIAGAKVGDSAALNAIWEVYYPKLVRLARGRLNERSRRVADEEDIAVSVFESFFRAASIFASKSGSFARAIWSGVSC